MPTALVRQDKADFRCNINGVRHTVTCPMPYDHKQPMLSDATARTWFMMYADDKFHVVWRDPNEQE